MCTFISQDSNLGPAGSIYRVNYYNVNKIKYIHSRVWLWESPGLAPEPLKPLARSAPQRPDTVRQGTVFQTGIWT